MFFFKEKNEYNPNSVIDILLLSLNSSYKIGIINWFISWFISQKYWDWSFIFFFTFKIKNLNEIYI